MAFQDFLLCDCGHIVWLLLGSHASPVQSSNPNQPRGGQAKHWKGSCVPSSRATGSERSSDLPWIAEPTALEDTNWSESAQSLFSNIPRHTFYKTLWGPVSVGNSRCPLLRDRCCTLAGTVEALVRPAAETQPFPSSFPGSPLSQVTADTWARLDPTTGQGFGGIHIPGHRRETRSPGSVRQPWGGGTAKPGSGKRQAQKSQIASHHFSQTANLRQLAWSLDE